MFVIIDGSALMCVEYYGSLPDEVKAAKTDEEKEASYDYIPHTDVGMYTNGINGFLGVVTGILLNQRPDHIAVCFDRSRDTTFRREMFSDYKAQRPQTPFPLSQQMREMQKICSRIGIPVFMSEKYEADDYAGTLAKKFENEDNVVLLTKDRDYFQLVTDNTHGWILQSPSKLEHLYETYSTCTEFDVPDRCYEYTPEVIEGELGIRPDQVADWKGLAGDPSDNIPGVKGVADKSAVPLLQEYGNIEGIYEAIDACQTKEDADALLAYWKTELGIFRPSVVFKALSEGRDQAFLCRELATIKTDIPIKEELSNLKTNIDLNELEKIAESLELYDYLNLFDEYVYSLEGEERE